MGEHRVDLDQGSWESLPGRALEVLARACSARLGARGSRAAERPSAEAVAGLVAGVTSLEGAVEAPRAPAPDPADVAAALRRAVVLTGLLGEAARRVAVSASAVGQEPAAESADAVMCAALTLRILAELALRTVPSTDAGDRPTR
jgi:hypothetical protein